MADQDSEFLEYEEAREGEGDLAPTTASDIASAVVSATDWTTETMLAQINKGNIVLNPKFQRRDAWSASRKSSFIESLILGLPVPQIVLAQSKISKGQYIVIDGKQRLLSIRQFSAAADDPDFRQLQLRDLEIRPDLNGATLESLRANPEWNDELRAFENETIRTVVIRNWPNEAFLYRVFLRLNTNSVGLSPQELRQALHPGPFVDYAEEVSRNNASIRDIMGGAEPDFRMRDVEIVIRYLALKFFLNLYAGSVKSFLDHACETLNQRWDVYADQLGTAMRELDEAHNMAKRVFGEKPYRKWTNGRYEGRFNRAIFDVMTYYFSMPNTREALAGQEGRIEQKFKDLCMNDREFLASIERTTKSVDATCTRLATWCRAINEIGHLNLPVPSVVDRRIR